MRLYLFAIPNAGPPQGMLAIARAESPGDAVAANPQLATALFLTELDTAVIRLLNEGREVAMIARLTPTVEAAAIDHLGNAGRRFDRYGEVAKPGYEDALSVVGAMFLDDAEEAAERMFGPGPDLSPERGVRDGRW